VNAPLGWQSTRAGGSGREIAGKTGVLRRRLPAGGFHRMPALADDQGGFHHGHEAGFLVTLEAKDGKGEELGEFLWAGREFAAAEEQTVTWYAFRIDATHYGIFDTFASEDGRQAHTAGPLAEALAKAADELLASEPSIRPVDVIAVK
jgi:quinol monooxygenase YgiN